MKTTRYANARLNASPITLHQVWGEVREVLEARTVRDLKEEVQDVLYFALCHIGHQTGLSLPLVGCRDTVAKIEARLVVWEELFTQAGVPFDVAYLSGGSNHAKPEKVALAFKRARLSHVG